MTSVRYPVVEFRQYTLHPGRRDDLIGLFERELIEPQEAAGMALVGQFRDADNPDRFVWFSRFTDPAGLSAHRDALAHCRHWHTTVRPALLAMLTGEPQQLTLAPTPRSLLR